MTIDETNKSDKVPEATIEGYRKYLYLKLTKRGDNYTLGVFYPDSEKWLNYIVGKERLKELLEGKLSKNLLSLKLIELTEQ